MTQGQPLSADLPPAIFLMGPTASGKTDLAVALCQALPCQVISVDSAMIYRDMDIGTAKPTPAALAQTPHRLIDCVDPAVRYSAAEFRQDALREMAGITAQGGIPLLVGGTMMYFKTLLEGMAELPAADDQLRASLAQEADQLGLQALHERLRQSDPDAAAQIHWRNRQRLLRALEVIALSGQPISRLWSQQQGAQQSVVFPYRALQLAIAPQARQVLHQRIEQRFRVMVTQGLLDEVGRLRARGDLSTDLPSMRCVGYRQVWEYLDGKTDQATMIDRAIAATRQLAKRQLTWLRKWPDLEWIDSEDPLREQVVIQRVQAFVRCNG